ncbi:MAG: hypothetical protein GKR94_33240 [Gammaproteobacteria bacterium]|nr:hypothetical protein [Gammaproteobacteria bacterium]
MNAAAWVGLQKELEAWAETGRSVSLWWRDDDAVADSHALRTLTAISGEYDVPLAMAVIPAPLETSLPAHLRRCQAPVSVCQHGFAHVNHVLAPLKKCELDAANPTQRLKQLAAGKAQLEGAFAAAFSPVLVPPWNRIAAPLASRLHTLGYAGLSTFAEQCFPAAALRQNNCHVDIINWRGTRGFVGQEAALAALTRHLRRRRQANLEHGEVTGVLSHHLVHDEACWLFLDRLWSTLRRYSHTVFCSLADLFSQDLPGG